MKKLFLLIIFSALLVPAAAAREDAPGTEALYFYSTHCKVCLSLAEEFLPRIEEKYKETLVIKRLNIDYPQNLSFLLSVVEELGLDKGVTPSILIGDDFLAGKHAIEQNLEFLIEKYSGKKISSRFVLATRDVVKTFKEISLLAILSAGLIDGINPCAFAVIVFFVSFLSVYGYSKKEIAVISVCYVFSVFCTYVLLGLGLLKVFYAIRHFYLLVKGFYYFVSLLCLVLAGFAVYDYIIYKKTGKGEALVLQLPAFLKKQVNFAIGSGLRGRHNTRTLELCLVSLLVGFVVSLLEAACTGQIYLPTVMYILKLPQLRVKAFFYLIFYNLMFIVPLVAVCVLSFLGVRSQQFNAFLKRRLGTVKLLMAGVFLVLAAAVFFMG